MDVKTAFLCVPIVCRNSVIGTLSIDRENPTRYELKRDLKLLETIANIIAYAVSVLFLDMEENEKLNAENRDLRERIDQELRPENAIGSSPAMLKAYELISAAGSRIRPRADTRGGRHGQGLCHARDSQRKNVAQPPARNPRLLYDARLAHRRRALRLGSRRRTARGRGSSKRQKTA